MKQKLFYSILLVLILFSVCFPVVASARAGGGGTGGGGGRGGGGFGGGGYYGGGYHYYRNRGIGGGVPLNGTNMLIMGSVIGGSAVGIAGLSIGLPYAKSAQRKQRAKKQMAAFSQTDPLWDVDFVRERVRDSFFEIQKCWSEQEISIGDAYLSDRLKEQFCGKLEWMKMQGKRNVLEQIELKKVDPILVRQSSYSSGNAVWMEIQAVMVDYTVLEEAASIPFSVGSEQEAYIAQQKTTEIVEGDLKKRPFLEYWLFVRRGNTWVLDEIRQKKERKQLVFPKDAA